MRSPSASSTAATCPSSPVTMRRTRPSTIVDPGGPQGLELGVVDVDAVVEHQGEPGAQLAEQPGGVEAHRVGDDLDDAPVADLEAVAERAVDDVAAPVLGEAVDVGELVDQTGGGEHPAGDDRSGRRRARRGSGRRRVRAHVDATRPARTSPP